MAGVLLVCGDRDLDEACRQFLTASGHSVGVARSANAAIRLLLNLSFEAIIVDSLLRDAAELWRWLRVHPEREQIPVLYAVASAVEARVSPPNGFRPGVDGLIEKPLSQEKLAHALESILDRVARARGGITAAISVGPCRLNFDRRRFSTPQGAIRLTRLETSLLRYLMERAGLAIAVDELLTKVWNHYPGTGSPEVVRAHVRNVRRKLQALAARDLIVTSPREGYRFDAGGEARTS